MNPLSDWQPPAGRIGRRIVFFERVGSTNAEALVLAGDLVNDGTVILAAEQTAGRGQHGRTWQCPPGAGILLSVLIFPPPELRQPAVLTAWAAVSVCAAIRATTALEPQIKWPNDVLVGGRKVCGILIEQGTGTVAGIGLNVNQPVQVFSEPGLTGGSSLSILRDSPLDVGHVTRTLVTQLDAEYDRLCRGHLHELESDWKRYVGRLGKMVIVECLDRNCLGQLSDLGFAGAEVIEPSGNVVRIRPETIRHIHLLARAGD